ncbi:MAG: anion permease, partial [Deltaproteobacteria bacterium]|nr:anion permease [Deltaproteobacteria bacterium]
TDANVLRRFTHRLLLAAAFAPNTGGIATPVSTPPNILAYGLLRKAGYQVSFIDWLAYGLPLSLAAFACLFALFRNLLPLDSNVRVETVELVDTLDKTSRAEWQTAIVFLVTVILWIVPDLLFQFGIFPDWRDWWNSRFSFASIACASASLLFILPARSGGEGNLEAHDLGEVPWGTLLLFGGGLSLSAMLMSSGLAPELASGLGRVVGDSPVLFTMIAILGTVFLSEFASNTASASLILPIVISQAGAPSAAGLVLALACTFAAGFGFMFPVSTPPNAIVYATGYVESRVLRKVGVLFDCIGILLILVGVLAVAAFD